MTKDKHYTKKRGHGSYTPWELARMQQSVARKGGAVRPEPYYSIFTRIMQAWDVLTYKADALYWKEPEEK